jgi:hypothetical protein
MGTINLSDEDEAVLEQLREGRNIADNLATTVSYDSSTLTDQLDLMADNDLVRDVGHGVYELTESGRRVLGAPGDASTDDRIDTPASVEQTLDEFDLPIECKEAVRRAFTFLRLWEEATATEIKDGVYDEKPADYASADEWWEQCVRDHLAALPHIEQPSSDDEIWTFTGSRSAAESTPNGRRMLDSDTEHLPPTSAKHTIETLADDDARQEAVLAAVEHIRQQGELNETDIKEAVYESYPAGYESSDEWWEQGVRDILEAVPGIEQAIPGEIWVATQSVNVDHEGRSHQTADENMATSTEEEETICPVCQRQYSGQVVLETNETVLSDYPLKRCVEAGAADTSDGAALAVYYHQNR